MSNDAPRRLAEKAILCKHRLRPGGARPVSVRITSDGQSKPCDDVTVTYDNGLVKCYKRLRPACYGDA